jgi:hypothetical protein
MLDCLAPLGADRARHSAYFGVARRREACLLPPPQHGGARSGFQDLRRTEEAEIEVGRRRLPISVQVAEGAEREVLWQRLLVPAPFFADHRKKVARQIPMAVLTPMT